MNKKAKQIYSALLGIYIPTKDRPNYLTETLESFIKQVKPYGYTIFISDQSTKLAPQTKRIVIQEQKKYRNIKYKHFKANG